MSQLIFFLNFRNYTTTLKDAVPLITTYEGLKSQFDWLTDGGISRLVESNLGRQIKQLEMFLRYQSFCLKILKTISILIIPYYPTFFLPVLFFPIPDNGSGSRLFTHPVSRGQKCSGSRIRIHNTRCQSVLKFFSML
jgi:hypothetical protein